MKKKEFTDKERIKIVKLHICEGRTQKSIAQEYGIAQSTLGRWIIKYRNGKMCN